MIFGAVVRDVQFLNIYEVLVTEVVVKLGTDTSAEQLANADTILVTESNGKLATETKLEHPLKAFDNNVTDLVSIRGIDVIEEHPLKALVSEVTPAQFPPRISVGGTLIFGEPNKLAPKREFQLLVSV